MFAVRSILFVPASRPDRFGKALGTNADLVAIDLEDAVERSAKGRARAELSAYLAGVGPQARGRLAVRINALTTPEGIEDLCALGPHAPRCVLLPKVESARDIEIATGTLGGDRALVPLVETVRGLDAARGIAAHPAVAALMFGGADFAGEIGSTLDWEALYAARSRLVMDAAASAKPLIDVPHVVLRDDATLIALCARLRAMGIAGKACIHPDQVDIVNGGFSPSEDEVERARKIVRAYRQGGLGQVDGEMVEEPLVRRYERLLFLAENHNHARENTCEKA